MPIMAVPVISRSSLLVYGSGSVLSSYSAVIVSPSATLSLCPDDSSSLVKDTVPSNIQVASFVSVIIKEIPPASESDQTSTSKLSTFSGSQFMSGSTTLTTPLPPAG